VPAYNEVRAIAKTIADAKAYLEGRRRTYEIIVCADGDDGTRELVGTLAAADPLLRVTGSRERRGKGHGIRQGVALAGGEIIGFVDADNKTPIEDFDRVEPCLADGYDIVIGSRGLRGSRIERPQPLHRRLGAQCFGIFMHAMVGLHDIVDTQCGFKFFRRHVARNLFGHHRIDGYMFDVEILYLARRAGYRVAQVPVRWRDDGDSRLALLSGNMRNLIDIFRIRFGGPRRSPVFPLAEEPDLDANGQKLAD
jgi:dolichyl-phosphate beta-glucosyltransferase